MKLTSQQDTTRFRHSPAITVAAVIVMITFVSLASWAAYLLPLVLLPLAVAIWSWRSGTDADRSGLVVRAALGSRRIAWSEVAEIITDPRGRVSARLTNGNLVALPAVTRTDVANLVAGSGKPPEAGPSADA